MLKLYSIPSLRDALVDMLCPASCQATLPMLHGTSTTFKYIFDIQDLALVFLEDSSARGRRHNPRMPSTSSSSVSCLSLRKVFYLGGHSRPCKLYGVVHVRRTGLVFRISLPDRPGMLPDQGKDCLTKLIKEGEAGVGVEYALTVRALLSIVHSSLRLPVSL